MQTIFKYKLNELANVNIVEAPIVKPLMVDFQSGFPHLWAIVSPDMPNKTIEVIKVGTGWIFNEDVQADRYLSTTVAQSEPYVWHWFYKEIQRSEHDG